VDYHFEKVGASTVSATIKAAANAVFQAKGYTLGNVVTGAGLYNVTEPSIAEVSGGNVGAKDFGYVTTPDGIEYDRPNTGFCVWWISGKVLTFNRTSSPTAAEVQDGLTRFAAMFPDVV
jgi:hypothetical protein